MTILLGMSSIFVTSAAAFLLPLTMIDVMFWCFDRRQKIATVLLQACDVLSILWGIEYLALRAYEDDLGARKLYASAGYQVVSGDPPWMTTWIGRKRRILMMKTSRNLHA